MGSALVFVNLAPDAKFTSLCQRNFPLISAQTMRSCVLKKNMRRERLTKTARPIHLHGTKLSFIRIIEKLSGRGKTKSPCSESVEKIATCERTKQRRRCFGPLNLHMRYKLVTTQTAWQENVSCAVSLKKDDFLLMDVFFLFQICKFSRHAVIKFN